MHKALPMTMSSLLNLKWPKIAAVCGLVAIRGRRRDGVGDRQNLPLIRDTEIESMLSDYARPVFRAAGLGTGRIKMRIVQNDAFNAFVLDGKNVFVHTGTLMQANTPNEVIGVIAHETGHITGGHMAALRARIAKDQTRALLVADPRHRPHGGRRRCRRRQRPRSRQRRPGRAVSAATR